MQQNDHHALSLIYKRYWHVLIDFVYKRLKNQQDAEEIVQELFIRLYERREELNIHTSLNAYLHTAARNRVYNKYRDWMQQRKAFKIFHLQDVDYTTPALYIAENKELENQIDLSIQKLPEKCREVFMLRRNERLSNTQVADRLQISVNTVEKHMGKAMKILKSELEKNQPLLILLIILITL